MRCPCPEPLVPRRRESPLSTVPACVPLLPRALLSEVACSSPGVEIVLDDPNNLRWGDAQDVARDDISRVYRIIDDQHCQLVTPRAVNPDELAILEQTPARVSGMQANQRSALGITGVSRDVLRNHEPGLKTLHHASSLVGADAPVALPTAT